MAYLVLVRHGLSEWNKLGKWTGLTEVDLAEEGIADARAMGKAISDIEFDHVHVSTLSRAKQTHEEIEKAMNKKVRPTYHKALNERDYGIYTGKDKWQVRDEQGEEVFHAIRRGWDSPVEGGENLKQVYERVIPHYETQIEPHLKDKNVLVVAHGNSLRALVKYLDNISDEDISKLEIGFGEVHVYEFENGEKKRKEIRQAGEGSAFHKKA